jgi:suppressor of G2 allele of SKP1
MAIKYSWYQTDSQVILEFFVKNVNEPEVMVDLEGDKVTECVLLIWKLCIRVPHLGEEKSLQLSHSVQGYEVHVDPTKVVLTLVKSVRGLSWENAEKIAVKPKAKRDWDKINDDSDNEKESSQSVEKYFKELFANAPEDVKKAMIKSYVRNLSYFVD